MNEADYALICKALGDETRIKIFQMLKGGEMCACKILEKFQFTQPTLSYHINILVGCGLVECRKVGKWSHYSVNEKILSDLAIFLTSGSQAK